MGPVRRSREQCGAVVPRDAPSGLGNALVVGGPKYVVTSRFVLVIAWLRCIQWLTFLPAQEG